jgi:hypothetical protein
VESLSQRVRSHLVEVKFCFVKAANFTLLIECCWHFESNTTETLAALVANFFDAVNVTKLSTGFNNSPYRIAVTL